MKMVVGMRTQLLRQLLSLRLVKARGSNDILFTTINKFSKYIHGLYNIEADHYLVNIDRITTHTNFYV